MAIYVPPQEPDEGLFYLRVWLQDSDRCTEQQFTSLKAAHDAAQAVYAAKAYERVELLQAREWGTRSTSKT